jgi:ADP-heptose:LPS heptosyltransferase
VVAHDTGLMHIAAAFQKKIIAIWGNTIPEFGMFPYRTVHENVEVSGLACRPCSKIGHAECPKGHFKCMQNIDTKRVGEIGRNWLSGSV